MSPKEKVKFIVDYNPSHADNDIVKEGLIYEKYFNKTFVASSIASCSLLQGEELLPTKTHRVFQFENEHVRVWKIMPHQPLKMHRHVARA